MRQSFFATAVTVSGPDEPLTVAFGNVKDDQTVIHSLLFSLDDEYEGPESIYMQFNDQGNAVSGPSIKSVVLGPKSMVVQLTEGVRLRGGTFADPTEKAVTEIEVIFEIGASHLLKVREALQDLLKGGCGLGSPGDSAR